MNSPISIGRGRIACRKGLVGGLIDLVPTTARLASHAVGAHIASALVFELSKVSLDHVRARVVGQLRNIDEDLAKRVAVGLAIDLPTKEKVARPPVELKSSGALSIQKNADDTMEGRQGGDRQA